MPNYQLHREVPWRNVVACLRLRLFFAIDLYRRVPSSCDDPRYPQLVKNLCESYDTYRKLRLFLGYKAHTKLERQARDLLQEISEKESQTET